MYCTGEDVRGELYIPLYSKMVAKFPGDELEDFLGQSILRAGDYVDAALSGVFDVPLPSPVPSAITTITAKIAAYFATARFSEQENVASDKMDAANAMLSALVQSGRMPGNLGKTRSLIGGSDTRVFTNEVLSRW